MKKYFELFYIIAVALILFSLAIPDSFKQGSLLNTAQADLIIKPPPTTKSSPPTPISPPATVPANGDDEETEEETEEEETEETEDTTPPETTPPEITPPEITPPEIVTEERIYEVGGLIVRIEATCDGPCEYTEEEWDKLLSETMEKYAETGETHGFLEGGQEYWIWFPEKNFLEIKIKEPIRYSCQQDLWQCVENNNGSYNSLQDCQASCKKTTTQYFCNNKTNECYPDISGTYSSLSECLSECEPVIKKYSCDIIKGICFENDFGSYASEADCAKACKPAPKKYACLANGTCIETPVGSYNTLKACQRECEPMPPDPFDCDIISFNINKKTNETQNPLYFIVNSVLKGAFSVSGTCIKCTVSSNDTWGNPPKTYLINPLAWEYLETFKINAPGDYSFTLTCQGKDPEDIDIDNISLKAVKVINLPWWREIIPYLQGFLRGLGK